MSEKMKLPGLLRKKTCVIPIGVIILVIIAGIVYFTFDHEAPVNDLLEREITRLEEEVARSPGSLGKRVELAAAYSEAGLQQKAIEQLEIALESEKDYEEALFLLGYIYLNSGQYQEALEPYGRIIELNQDNPMRHINRRLEAVYYYIGIAYFNLNRFEEAIRSFQEALLIDRTDADAWYRLGASYQSSGNYQLAIDSYYQAIRFVPDFGEAYRGLAFCYQQTGQTGLVLYAEAMENYSSGLHAEAISQLEEVVAGRSDFAEAYLGLGLAYEAIGENTKAIDAFERAFMINPDLWLAKAKAEELALR